MHGISVAAVALLLALGCQGDKKDRPAPGDQAAAKNREAGLAAPGVRTEGPGTDQGAAKPAATTPPGPASSGGLRVDRAPAPAIELDCDDLLTAADLERLCGVKAGWTKDPYETGSGPTSCSRRAGPDGAFVRFAVGVYPHSESARAVTRGAQPGSVKVERKRAGGASTVLAHMRKGNIAITASATRMASKEPPCNDEQLGQLAQVIDSRLP